MAKVKVIFPSVMTSLTAGEKETGLSASTLSQAIDEIVARYGDAFRERVLDSSGKLKRLLNFYVNGKNVRFLKQLETPLNDGDEISIIPLASGG